MKFLIEQVALHPRDPKAAIALLKAIGLARWALDRVVADGHVYGLRRDNAADLAFNYDATRGVDPLDGIGPDAKPLELEVLHYAEGDHWMRHAPFSVSHLGMHCSADELLQWREKFAELNIEVAQEVFTQSHTNPAIAGERWYNYVIFATRHILGVDLKFIVRMDQPGKVEEE